MNIIVCIKQVPGTSSVEIDPDTGVLKRAGVESKLNPYDLYGIELALRLKEQHGGTVRVITMGPPQASSAVLEALYMGADDGFVISDRAFAGSDVLATSYTLSQGIRKIGKFDLIICGKQTTDGDTAQVGAELAEFLEIPHASNVGEIIASDNGRVTVRVSLDRYIVTERIQFPCLLCVDSEINTPRLPSYKRKLAILRESVGTISLADLSDQDVNHYGLNGSPTQVERIFPPEKKSTKQLLVGKENQITDELFRMLKERKFL